MFGNGLRIQGPTQFTLHVLCIENKVYFISLLRWQWSFWWTLVSQYAGNFYILLNRPQINYVGLHDLKSIQCCCHIQDALWQIKEKKSFKLRFWSLITSNKNSEVESCLKQDKIFINKIQLHQEKKFILKW